MTERDLNLPAEVPVLLVGGGPVGLSTASLLAHQGVTSLLIEQHAGTSHLSQSAVHQRAHDGDLSAGRSRRAVRDVAVPDARNAIGAKSLAGEVAMSRPVETMIQAW